MRYKEIINYETETTEEKQTRLALMYGDAADSEAKSVQTDLARAEAEKLRAEAKAAEARIAEVRRAEEKNEERALDAEQALIGSLIPRGPLKRPD